MSTLSSVVQEARLNLKLQLLNADILLAQKEYTRIYKLTGDSEQLHTAWTLENDLQIVKRRILGKSTFEDKYNLARDIRVAALELRYEERVFHGLEKM